MTFERLNFRVHAIQRMFERDISEVEVRDVLENGKLVEIQDDVPFPSRIMLGYVGGRPVHVVASDNPEEQATIVITVYEPSPFVWDQTFMKRR
jgi:hypothetical protein